MNSKYQPFIFYAAYSQELHNGSWCREVLPGDMVKTSFRCLDGHLWTTTNSISEGSPALKRRIFIRCKECDFNAFVYLVGDPDALSRLY